MSELDITIAGEINLDLILYGLPEQMPTERELIASNFAMTLGSSSAILAHNLSALGSRVGFITKVGEDACGNMALLRVGASGMDLTRIVRRPDGMTGITVILHHGRDRHILTYLGTISELRFEELDLSYLASARHFHLSSLYLQRALMPRVPELFRYMKKAGLTTSLDTNDDPEDRWSGALEEVLPFVDVLLPNEREAMKMTGVASLADLDWWRGTAYVLDRDGGLPQRRDLSPLGYKLVFSVDDRRLLGVHAVGEMASELVHVGQACLHFGGTIDYFVQAVFNYPTLADAYKYAAYDGLANLERAKAHGPSTPSRSS